MEGRGCLVALGTTLIGVGLAAFFAFYIAMAALAPGRRGAYGWVPDLGIAVASVGLVLGVAWLFSLDANRRRINQLGLFMIEGQARRHDVATASDDATLNQALQSARKWHDVIVSTWVRRYIPIYTYYTLYAWGLPDDGEAKMADRDRYLFEIDLLLQRIAELAMRL